MTNELLCPRCYQPLPRCQGKHAPLPLGYAEKCRAAPPLWLTLAGFNQHGKTVYLSALTLMLEELGTAVPGFALDSLGDSHTFDAVREMRRKAALGETSDATKVRTPVPLFLRIPTGPLGTGGRDTARTFVLYDAAGESFSNVDTLREEVPSVVYSDVLWFLVSLEDLKSSGEYLTLSDLFQTYRSAMERAGQKLAYRRIVVVLTKADRIEHLIAKEFGNAVNDYLAEDPFSELTLGTSTSPGGFTLQDYLAKAAPISDQLREFVCRRVPGGRNFVQLAESHQVDVRFCITSAIGHQPDQDTGRFVEKAIRYRVLDPLFWTLAAESRRPEIVPDFRLVLDASRDSSDVFVDDRPGAIWDALSRHANTTTHFLGQSRPAAMIGQRPKCELPWRRGPRLIGPILDSLRENESVIVVTSGKIGDLAEFRNSSWRNRILLAVTREQLQDLWPNVWVLRPDDDYEHMTRHLMQLRSPT